MSKLLNIFVKTFWQVFFYHSLVLSNIIRVASSSQNVNFTNSITGLNDSLNDLKTSFQGGCSTIATALTNLGVITNSSATPDQIVENIKTLATNKYNSGYSNGKAQPKIGTVSASVYSNDRGDTQHYTTVIVNGVRVFNEVNCFQSTRYGSAQITLG